MRIVLPLLFLFLSFSLFARTNSFQEESLYNQYKIDILKGSLSPKILTTKHKNKILMDALWDLVVVDHLLSISSFYKIYKTLDEVEMDLADRLRAELLLIVKGEQSTLSDDVKYAILAAIYENSLQRRTLFIMLNYRKVLEKILGADVYMDMEQKYGVSWKLYTDAVSTFVPQTKETLRDIFYYSPDLSQFMDGEYEESIKAFALCRHDRSYPCLLVLKNMFNLPVFVGESKTLWSQPILGFSVHNLPFHFKNGDTPMGVHTMDSVMPEADQQEVFGKYRRVMLNFVDQSAGEYMYKRLLPESAHAYNWWKGALVARDVGRNLLRIHGTSLVNEDPTSHYFPFVPTSGCMAQREGIYNGVEYKDQRKLLDMFMLSLGLEPTYENETEIKGLLYVIEIDDKKAPVTHAEVQSLLIDP